MPRRRVVAKREILPDPLFSSELLAKFINCVMKSGKKSVAERIVYGALDEINKWSKKAKKDQEGDADASGVGSSSLEIFETALDNIRPTVEVRARRVGGSTYQIPCEVRTVRGIALAMRWLIKAAQSRSEKTMTLRLAAEIWDAMAKKGKAISERENMHRMAKANQAFAHFRWN
jgi:small subunit ribosomal protein S7